MLGHSVCMIVSDDTLHSQTYSDARDSLPFERSSCYALKEYETILHQKRQRKQGFETSSTGCDVIATWLSLCPWGLRPVNVKEEKAAKRKEAEEKKQKASDKCGFRTDRQEAEKHRHFTTL